MDCLQLELYTNNFGGTMLKRNCIWGYANKGLNTGGLEDLEACREAIWRTHFTVYLPWHHHILMKLAGDFGRLLQTRRSPETFGNIGTGRTSQTACILCG
jgi:hypothetical protein